MRPRGKWDSLAVAQPLLLALFTLSLEGSLEGLSRCADCRRSLHRQECLCYQGPNRTRFSGGL
jgi:hypothetical protein